MKYSSKAYTVEEAKRSLERYCIYQDRCHQEVQQKLKKMGMIPEASDLIIVHLINHNFLNEERFAKSYARGKFNLKSWGRVRITSELKKRNIGSRIIREALREISEEDYLSKLNHITCKKNNEIKTSNILERKKKLFHFLIYRGWENHLIYDSINRVLENENLHS